MHDDQFYFDVNARREDVWAVFWGKKTGDVVKHLNFRTEILHGGVANGEGLIRLCHYPVPRYLLSGGEAQRWEWLSQVNLYDSWRYDGIGKSPWSKTTGWIRLEELEHQRTRIHLRESYHVVNPILRFLLEKKVHRVISRNTRRKMQIAIEYGLRTGAHKSHASKQPA